jgi:hypothetical protein
MAMELNPLKIPVSSLAAPAAVLVFFAFLLVSARGYPQGFSPLHVSISNLGNGELNPGGADVFNIGCMIAGLLLVPFFAGLYKWYTDELWRNLFVAVAQAAGIIAGVSLFMTGHYPEQFVSEHSFWTTVLFASLLLALLLANAGLLTHWRYSNWVGYVGLAATAVIAVFFAGMLAIGTVPIFEWASIIMALVWSLAVAVDMYFTFA